GEADAHLGGYRRHRPKHDAAERAAVVGHARGAALAVAGIVEVERHAGAPVGEAGAGHARGVAGAVVARRRGHEGADGEGHGAAEVGVVLVVQSAEGGRRAGRGVGLVPYLGSAAKAPGGAGVGAPAPPAPPATPPPTAPSARTATAVAGARR